MTPLRRITGWNEIVKLRRMFGLFAFFYGTLHLLTWIVFVNYFDIPTMIVDIGKRPFITVGMATWTILFRSASRRTLFGSKLVAAGSRSIVRTSPAFLPSFTGGWSRLTSLPRRWAFAIGSLLLFRIWWANRGRLSLRS